MSQRLYNFSAGPAALPEEVLRASAAALVDYEGKGFGIAEVSHRGKEFAAVLAETTQRCKQLMGIGDDYEVLYLQGGATQCFHTIPMNLLHGRGDYVVSGQWAKKAAQAGAKQGDTRVLASSEDSNFDRLPTGWQGDPTSDYLHICSNNTIFGTRFAQFPEHHCLIADMSSEIMSRVIDVQRFGLIYAGAQKNLGPSGVTLMIIRKDLLERVKPDLPAVFDFAQIAKAESCLNTPPTFGIYILLETFRWLERQGGIAAMEERNDHKAQLIYDTIDGSDGFYRGTVQDHPNRSTMNITFVLPDEELTKRFLAGAEQEGMIYLKGYRSVGGVRASTYNAMSVDGCQKLADYMREFQQRAG